MNNVYLTSFQASHALPPGVVPMSAAVYQPKGYAYEKVAWTDIRYDGEHWIRPREFVDAQNPLAAYREALYGLYMARKNDAELWVGMVPEDVALCCWCPYERAARRQIEQWGSYVCHLSVVGEFIYNELGVAIWTDGDRRNMAVLTQR